MAEPTVETLDVRDMVPRERHPTIFDRLEVLDPGGTLCLVIDHDPAQVSIACRIHRYVQLGAGKTGAK